MNIKIIAVTVIFNDYNNFKRLLSGLINQSLKLDGLVVVDNSDKICNELNDIIANVKEFPIYYVKTKKNIGSAGGFALGMVKARDFDYDWIWLNDSDGLPQYNCLEMLIKYADEKLDKILVPQKVDIIDRNTNLSMDSTDINIFQKLYLNKEKFKSNKETITIISSSSTGSLIGKNVISKIGIYDYKHYFVGLEDIDFFLRSYYNHIKVELVKKAIYFHPNLLKKQNISNKGKISKYFPLYLGYIQNNKRFHNSIYSRAFLCGKYFSELNIIITFIYSLLRTILIKPKVAFNTYKLYIKGIGDGIKEKFENIGIKENIRLLNSVSRKYSER